MQKQNRIMWDNGNVTKIRTTIEMRSLTSKGHIFTLPNTRLTKQLLLGRPRETIHASQKRSRETTINYWRSTLKDRGQNPEMNKPVA